LPHVSKPHMSKQNKYPVLFVKMVRCYLNVLYFHSLSFFVSTLNVTDESYSRNR
jgi:hypothetical protein